MACASAFQELANRNPVLQEIVDIGYVVDFIGGHVVIYGVKHLDEHGALQYGVLCTPVDLGKNNSILATGTHQCWWRGGKPHCREGVVLPLSPQSNNTQIILTFNSIGTESAIRREERAINQIQDGDIQLPQLKALLDDPSKTQIPMPIAIQTVLPDLDDDKRQAVEAAIGSSEILLVIGPPGTGKTQFIAELVLQELKRKPTTRILIAAQTHIAVDNALKRVRTADGALKCIRIGTVGDDRISEASRALLLDATVTCNAARCDDWEIDQIGSTTYGSSSSGYNWQSQQIGGTTYGSDSSGYTWNTQRIGSSSYGSGSDGYSWQSQRIGSQTYGSDDYGNTWQTQQIGNSAYYNDSSGNSVVCQQIGDQVYCN